MIMQDGYGKRKAMKLAEDDDGKQVIGRNLEQLSYHFPCLILSPIAYFFHLHFSMVQEATRGGEFDLI